MKTVIPFCSLLLTLLLGSCQSEADSPRQPHVAKSDHRVTLMQALERRNTVRGQIPAENRSGAINQRTIEKIEYITDGTVTRSNLSDTLFYVVNYANECGFDMLAADDRILPVIAMADEGHLSFSDTTFNKGLKFFYDQAIYNGKMAIKDPIEIIIDPLDYRFDRRRKPMMSDFIRKFNQRSPYNRYCFTLDGQQAVAGCGPIATAQILCHYGIPEQLGGESVNWPSILEDENIDELARFIARIGQPDYLNATYGTSATSTPFNAFASVFRQCGWTNGGYEYFCKDNVGAALETDPVFVYGENKNKNSAHVWVMDGYIRFSASSHSIAEMPQPSPAPWFYFHCVWGWGGTGNGYYYFWNDGTLGGSADSWDEGDNGSNSPYTYYRMHTIIHNK